MPKNKYLQYGLIIALGLYAQFSLQQVHVLYECMAHALRRIFTPLPAVAESGEGATPAILYFVLMPFAPALLYGIWLSGGVRHALAVGRGEITKRFVDFRFVYLVAQLKRQNSALVQEF